MSAEKDAEKALAKALKLIALAGSSFEEEARSAAYQACKLIREHKLELVTERPKPAPKRHPANRSPGGHAWHPPPPRAPVDASDWQDVSDVVNSGYRRGGSHEPGGVRYTNVHQARSAGHHGATHGGVQSNGHSSAHKPSRGAQGRAGVAQGAHECMACHRNIYGGTAIITDARGVFHRKCWQP